VLALVATRDGRFVYASGPGAVLLHFERDAETGSLAYHAVDSFYSAISLALSRDESRLFLADNSLGAHLLAAQYAFARDRTTGSLTMEPGGTLSGAYDYEGIGDNFIVIEPFFYTAGQFTSQNPIPIVSVQAEPPFSLRAFEVDGTDGADALQGAAAAVATADGAHVYVAANGEDAIQIFARDPNGDLAPLGAVRDGVGGVDGLNGVAALAASPGGEHVYAASQTDDAVAAFAHNATSGALAFVELERDGVGGVTGLNGASRVAVSPDGAHVYASAPSDAALTSFARDASSGALTLVDQDADAAQLGLIEDFAIAPDGRHLYTAAPYIDSIGVFARSPASGALTPLAAIDLAPLGFSGLAAVAIAPDGRHVYATESFGERVIALARDPASGALVPLDVYTRDGLVSTDLAVTRDGRFVVAPAENFQSLLVSFARDRDSGRLAFRGYSRRDSFDASADAIALAPDGRNLYATSRSGDAVGVAAPEPGGAAIGAATLLALLGLAARSGTR
jgi:6-phosphogluconolactonase (cycloisomerase 2 family)